MIAVKNGRSQTTNLQSVCPGPDGLLYGDISLLDGHRPLLDFVIEERLCIRGIHIVGREPHFVESVDQILILKDFPQSVLELSEDRGGGCRRGEQYVV